MEEKGYLALILHAHLPFVRHPEYKEFLEERWFFEALTETYIPLLSLFERLVNDKIEFYLTLSISPTLLSMLTDSLLKERYINYLNKMIELCEKEIERTRFSPSFHKLALMYYYRFSKTKDKFLNQYNQDLIKEFKKYQDRGFLEIITSTATHGFLPLLLHKEAIKAQIEAGVSLYSKIFSTSPSGLWLPECGYFEGLDKFLKECGIKYFILETHGVLFARPRPKFGVYSSYYTKNRVAVFGRDPETSKSVWSSIEGYPGDYNYREYFRDIGFDLDYDYIKPYISPSGARIFTGIKYYKITGPTPYKEPYVPEKAREKAAEHAGNFMFNRERQIEYLYSVLGRKPVVVAPYDAELFGHWWFEGIDWLEFLIRKIKYDQNIFKLITPSLYLKLYPKNQRINPAPSSWGWKGYYEVWLNGSNDWIYPHLHRAQEVMINLAKRFKNANGEKRRVLNQMARELLLAQASDWAFMMKTGSFSEYAKKRVITHLERFYLLKQFLEKDFINYEVLEDIENKDNIFPDLDYALFHS